MSKEPRIRVPIGQGRVMILANLAEIREGVLNGHTSRTLFNQLEARLDGMSYRQFCRYVDRIRLSFRNPDLEMIKLTRAAASIRHGTARPADRSLVTQALPATSTTQNSTQEIKDGPKAPSRHRGFVRLAGLPDDNKDKLI